MVKETDWQTKIIASAKRQGGYGKKWATQHTMGAPDLILALPKPGPGGFIMEVKLIKGLANNFSRKVNTTEKQRIELANYEKAGGVSCVGMITYYKPTEVYLTILNWNTETFTEARLCHGPTVRWMGKEMFDLTAVMQAWYGFNATGEII